MLVCPEGMLKDADNRCVLESECSCATNGYCAGVPGGDTCKLVNEDGQKVTYCDKFSKDEECVATCSYGNLDRFRCATTDANRDVGILLSPPDLETGLRIQRTGVAECGESEIRVGERCDVACSQDE